MQSFGWECYEVDGHSVEQLTDVFKKCKNDKPLFVIANTTKGKGVSFMEDDNNWHYRVPTADEVEAARLELGVT